MHLQGLLPLHVGAAAEDHQLPLAGHDVGCPVDGVTEDDDARVIVRLCLGDDLRVEAGIGDGVPRQVDGVVHAAVGRQEGPQALLEGRRRNGGGEAVLLRLVDGEDGGAAGTGDGQQAAALRLVQVSQGLGEVVQLLQVVRPADLVFPEDGLVDLVGSRQGLGVALRRHAAPGGPARLEDDHGLVHRPQRLQEGGGSLDPLHVEGDHPGVPVLVEVSDAVRFVHVRPVAEADEDAHAEGLLGCPVHQGRPDGAALGDEGHPAAGGEERPGRAEAGIGGVDPLAVGADQADVVFPGCRGQLGLEPFPFFPRFGEAAGDDHGGLHAGLAALFDGPDDHPRRDHDHGKVRRRWDGGDVPVGLQAQEFVGLRVHGKDGALEPGVDQVVEHVVAELPRRSGGPDHGDAPRLEDGVQAALPFHVPSFFGMDVSESMRQGLRPPCEDGACYHSSWGISRCRAGSADGGCPVRSRHGGCHGGSRCRENVSALRLLKPESLGSGNVF